MDVHTLALAYALSSLAGLRATLTLLALAIAAHLGAIHPAAGYAWLGTDTALAALAALSAVDLAADKVPLVDHGLHALHTVLAPLVGAVAATAAVPGGGDPLTLALVVLGGTNALGIHAARATTRGLATGTTGGLLTPVLSFAGDAVAVTGLLAVFAQPVAVAAAALVLSILVALAARRVLGRRRRYVASTVPPR